MKGSKTHNHIILIGSMGSGKSTLGKAISDFSGLPYLDTDAWIEQEENRSVSTIFTEEGESYFRSCEKKSIAYIKSLNTTHVISTGGGLPIYNDLMTELLLIGKVYFLHVGVDVIFNRVVGSKHRPLLSDNPALVKKDISAILKKRLPVYRKAHYTLMASRPIESIVARIWYLHHTS